MRARNRYLIVMALLLTAAGTSTLWAVDVVSYKSMAGVVWHQQDLYVTINSFTDEWKSVVGKNWYMTMTVQNQGDTPATFNASQLEIDNGKGTRFMAKPISGASVTDLKQTIPPGGSAQFQVMFDGHIFFDRRLPAHLKYTLDTKVDIIK
jgi:hypothetical protein